MKSIKILLQDFLSKKPVNGVKYYFITKTGKLFSLLKAGQSKPTNIYTIRKPWHDRDGYERYRVRSKGVAKHLVIHRLVAQTFLPNPNKLPQVNHINGNRTDNRVENLYWGTQKDNAQDAIRHGTFTGMNKWKVSYSESKRDSRVCDVY